MISVLIDLLLVLWVVAFGAMAIVPLMLGGHRSSLSDQQAVETEDRVLSIVPSPFVDRLYAKRPATERNDPEHRRAA